jgi:hypothetical protein
MNITEAVAEVVSITKRADKATEILSNINKAIAFWTLKANFRKDYAETTLTLDPDTYGQTLDLSDLAISTPDIVRFRKIAWLRPTSRRYYLKEIDPGQILTPGGQVQTNRFYMAGSNLTVTLSNLDATLEMGYFSYAQMLDLTTNTSHWMLDMIPWAVTERAASQTFKSIGDDASATFYAASSMEFFLAARRDFEYQTLAAAS